MVGRRTWTELNGLCRAGTSFLGVADVNNKLQPTLGQIQLGTANLEDLHRMSCKGGA